MHLNGTLLLFLAEGAVNVTSLKVTSLSAGSLALTGSATAATLFANNAAAWSIQALGLGELRISRTPTGSAQFRALKFDAGGNARLSKDLTSLGGARFPGNVNAPNIAASSVQLSTGPAVAVAEDESGQVKATPAL